ncbi:hypothetical protein [Microcoleus sp. herbarium12]|uniref:hypothetical protein n=1 Tax=Microcoleus sp. herbarium12 TaxID=3055437 RepID=UPI002FD04862
MVASGNWRQQGGLGGGGVEGKVEVEGFGCVAVVVGGYEAEGVIAVFEGVAADGFELGAAEGEAVATIDERGDVGEFAGGGVVETGAEAGNAAVVEGDATADRRIGCDTIAIKYSCVVG